MKRTVKMWISFSLIFLFGAAVGISSTAYFVRSHIKGFMKGGPPEVHTRIIRRAVRDLELDQRQRDRIDEIIRESRPEIKEISLEFGASMREITDRQIEQIKEVLTPEQSEIVEERMNRFREHFRKVFREGKWKRGRPHRDNHRHPHSRCE
jgi:Spy/CpxP family protein refolding chaperone